MLYVKLNSHRVNFVDLLRVNNISPNKIVATTKNIIIIYSPEIYLWYDPLKLMLLKKDAKI